MKIINCIINWFVEYDHKAKMEQAKRIDYVDDKWCNAAYEWLYNNF